jgi:hypothetical protein
MPLLSLLVRRSLVPLAAVVIGAMLLPPPAPPVAPSVVVSQPPVIQAPPNPPPECVQEPRRADESRRIKPRPRRGYGKLPRHILHHRRNRYQQALQLQRMDRSEQACRILARLADPPRRDVWATKAAMRIKHGCR